MNRVFGIETEFGITVDGVEHVDVVAESIELVRRYTDHGALMKWTYRLEDPHRDARGFRATELLQDTDEAAYVEVDRNRPLSFEEIKATSSSATARDFTMTTRTPSIRRRNARPCGRWWRRRRPASAFWRSACGGGTSG